MEENKDLLEEYEEEEKFGDEEEPAEPLPEALFRIRTVLDAKAQEEATKTVRGKLLDIITWLFMGICLAFAALMFWQYFTVEEAGTSNLIFGILMIVVLLFSLYNKLFGGKKALQKWESNMIRQFGTSALHLTTEFFPRSLSQSVEEIDNVLVEGYSSVSSMKESENLFLLNCGGRQWFFIDKKGFEVGDAESFRKFISEKIGG